MKKNTKVDVLIVGGGASGLAAAVELGMSSPELSVLVAEKMDEPARKLRATGSGRCNITNTEAAGYKRITEFFSKIGLVTKAYDNGLVYPNSESASDVCELLIKRAESLGVKIVTGLEIKDIKALHSDANESMEAGIEGIENECSAKNTPRFTATCLSKDGAGEHETIIESKYVILASGGKAGPMYGNTGDGYRIAKSFGHSIVTPIPALTGIECEEWSGDAEPNALVLGGTRAACRVSLYKGSDKLFEESGEIQFTKYGLSGICVFNMSRCMRYDRAGGESLNQFEVRADLFPGGDIRDYIKERMNGAFSEAPVSEMLCTLIKKNQAEYVLMRASEISAPEAGGLSKEADFMNMPLSALSEKDIAAIYECVHRLKFRPKAVRGWKDAQVTAGGVAVNEIDDESAESKLVQGLYICGELADRDFPCGGYNLSNAWITGIAAADDITNTEE